MRSIAKNASLGGASGGCVYAAKSYRVFARSSKHRANVEQTSTNIELAQAGLLESFPLAQM